MKIPHLATLGNTEIGLLTRLTRISLMVILLSSRLLEIFFQMPIVQQSLRLGFSFLSAKVLAEPDREKLEMDTIDEQLDTTGKVFLGMTFGCVRCHDHKFDPITQADYYGLAAIFKITQTFGDTNTGAIKHWNEHVFATAEDLESMKEVEDRIAALKSSATDFRNRAYGDLRQKVRSQAVDYMLLLPLLNWICL